jgi:IclR family acetate operon transcriptional repressor
MRSLSHGLSVLAALSRVGTPASLAELAEQVGLHRSTVHRILTTLLEHGLVRKDDGGRYVVGLAALELARSAGYTAVDDPISQEVTALHLVTRARAVYAVPRFGQVACVVASERGEVSFPIVPQYALLPLHSTAAGKAYLAFRPEREVEQFLQTAPFPATTSHTRTSAKELRQALAAVRQSGYATEIREYSPQGRALAVPVRDPRGLSVASVALGLPDGIVSQAQARAIAAQAAQAADRISGRLVFSVEQGNEPLTQE